MRGLHRVAHAPPWPGDHDRLACCARVRGLPPPAAVRCSAALRAHSRGDPPHEGPSAAHTAARSPSIRASALAGASGYLEAAQFTREARAVRMHVAATNVTDVHKLAMADRPIMRG